MLKVKFETPNTLTNLYSINADTDILDPIYIHYDDIQAYAPHITNIADEAKDEYIMSIHSDDSSLRELKRIGNMFLGFKYNISVKNDFDTSFQLEYTQIKNLLKIKIHCIDPNSTIDDVILSKFNRVIDLIIKNRNTDYVMIECSYMNIDKYILLKNLFDKLYEKKTPCLLYNDSLLVDDDYIHMISKYHALFTIMIYDDCWHNVDKESPTAMRLNQLHFVDIWQSISHKTIL